MAESNQSVTEVLARKFDQNVLKKRKTPDGGGKMLTYVDGTTVFRRLIDATDNQFDVEVIEQEMIPFGETKGRDNQPGRPRLLLRATVRLSLPNMGSRTHVGVQVVNADSGGEDLWKGAVTDGIKKAATLFGVGLELYGTDVEESADTVLRGEDLRTERQYGLIVGLFKKMGYVNSDGHHNRDAIDAYLTAEWQGATLDSLSKTQAKNLIDLLQNATANVDGAQGETSNE